MPIEKLEIGASCWLVKTEYGEGFKSDISFDYVEHSTYCMFEDSETSIDINKEKAI